MLIMLVNEKLTHIKIHGFYYGMAYKVTQCLHSCGPKVPIYDTKLYIVIQNYFLEIIQERTTRRQTTISQSLTTTLKAFPCPYLIYPGNVYMNQRLILRESKKLAPDHKGAHECKGAAYEYKIGHPDRSLHSPAFGLYSLNLEPNPLLCMVHFPQAPSQPTQNFHLTHVK